MLSKLGTREGVLLFLRWEKYPVGKEVLVMRLRKENYLLALIGEKGDWI